MMVFARGADILLDLHMLGGEIDKLDLLPLQGTEE